MHLRILPQSLILTTTIIVAPPQRQKYKQNANPICRLPSPHKHQMTNTRQLPSARRMHYAMPSGSA